MVFNGREREAGSGGVTCSSIWSHVMGGMASKGSWSGAAGGGEWCGLEVSAERKVVFIDVLHLMAFTDTNGHGVKRVLVCLWCASVDGRAGRLMSASGVEEGGGCFLLSQAVLGAGEAGTTGGIMARVVGAGRRR